MDDQLSEPQDDSARRSDEGEASPEDKPRVPFDDEPAAPEETLASESPGMPEDPVEALESFEKPETFEVASAADEEPEPEAPEANEEDAPPPTPEFPAEQPPVALTEDPPTEAAAVEPSPVETPEAPAAETIPEPEPEPEPETEAAPEPEPDAEAEPATTPEPGSNGEVVAAEAAPPVDEGPFSGPGDWYVIHCYAGYENKVKSNLQSRIHTMQMEEKIFDVVVPMEDVMEIKGGRKQVVQKKFLPGYVLVKMIYDNDSWYVVRNTPGVTGFVSSGTGQKPTPVPRREIEKILVVKKEETKPAFRLEFEEGDVVRIISGPFADFNGTIDEINMDQSKVKVMVNIFDRETPVELSFDQVARV